MLSTKKTYHLIKRKDICFKPGGYNNNHLNVSTPLLSSQHHESDIKIKTENSPLSRNLITITLSKVGLVKKSKWGHYLSGALWLTWIDVGPPRRVFEVGLPEGAEGFNRLPFPPPPGVQHLHPSDLFGIRKQLR